VRGSSTEQDDDERFFAFSRPSMGDAELAALREVLASGWITTGPKNQALKRHSAS
jgi:dTDP-4-amino-4,6-dideoxygalactose transaminase